MTLRHIEDYYAIDTPPLLAIIFIDSHYAIIDTLLFIIIIDDDIDYDDIITH
jgi:hypothetical protein